jgi:formate dehydrogenase major subunit/formate dehydrogenase-N alpha subunit
VYCGSWTEQGNQMANRDNSDPYGLGCTPGWAWSWPANRRILYNRASADPAGKPWDAKRALLHWDGKKWAGWTWRLQPGRTGQQCRAVYHEPGRVARLFSSTK